MINIQKETKSISTKDKAVFSIIGDSPVEAKVDVSFIVKRTSLTLNEVEQALKNLKYRGLIYKSDTGYDVCF